MSQTLKSYQTLLGDRKWGNEHLCLGTVFVDRSGIESSLMTEKAMYVVVDRLFFVVLRREIVRAMQLCQPVSTNHIYFVLILIAKSQNVTYRDKDK